LCLPIFSPDLYWHLSAGRWIWAHGAIPRVDPFTFTAGGTPWIDFEWAVQLIWFTVERWSGLWGLWFFKAGLLAAAFFPLDGFLRDRGASKIARAGALGLWLAAILAQADLRVDLISASFFAVLLRRLSRGQASFLFGFALFASWSNLHGGFALGFLLYLSEFAAARLERRRPAEGLTAEACGAALGSLINPYGLKLYSIFAAHAAEPAMARFVMEWGPPSIRNPYQAPLLVALLAVAGAAWTARKRALVLPLLAALITGVASLLSARFGAYFAAAGAALAFSAHPKVRPTVVAGGLAALSALLIVPVSLAHIGSTFDDRHVARRAADFVAREQPTLLGLRLFNQYEWGGYLGWRLGEGGKVFGDGRYLFHHQLADLQDALSSADNMAAFVAREKLDGLLIRNFPDRLPSTRAYPDGTTRHFLRPWYLTFLPRERWALAYWDDQALLFVDRRKVPSGWLAAHEYVWFKPGDEVARANAAVRGEIPAAAFQAEVARHSAENR
jgi:hypothetical protein